MEQSNDHVFNFEMALKHHRSRKRQGIYSENAQNSGRHYTPKDVLSNVSKQMNALQRANGTKNLNPRSKVLRCKKGALEPVNLLTLESDHQQSCEIVNKFETQGVSDTQLIQIIENVENLMVPDGVTQEFENSFFEQQTSGRQLINQTCNNITHGNNEISNDLNKRKVTTNNQKNCISKQNVSPDVEVTVNEKNEMLLEIDSANDIFQDIKSSPITNKPLTNCHSPLICTKDAFENFEAIAFPIVENNTDLEEAKQLISSEINRKMLYLCNQTKTSLNKTHIQPCPVLNKINLKMPLSNFTYKEVISQEIEKRPESRNIMEDGVFFSGKEDNVEETKFQELPLTCAVESSFYNEHDKLDKTMLVGFQTASNKFIEIKTDSFCKAFSILEEVNGDNLMPTLKKLVKIHDAGNKSNFIEKCVDSNVNVNLSNKNSRKHYLEVDDIKTHDVNLSEVEASVNKFNLSNKLGTVPGEPSDVVPKYMKNNNSFVNLKQNCLHANDAKSRHHSVLQDLEHNKKCYISGLKKVSCNKVIKTSQTNNVRSDPSTDLDIVVSESNENESKDFMEVFKHINLDVPTIIQEFENDLIIEGNNKRAHESESSKNVAKNKRQFAECNNKDIERYNKNVEVLNNEPFCISQIPKTNFTGFTTASNKKITISEQALARTKNIFEGCNILGDFDNNAKTNSIGSYNLISEKVVFSNKILQNNEVLIEDNCTESPKDMFKVNNKAEEFTSKILDNSGFKICSDKPVVLPSEELVNSSKMLTKFDKLSPNVSDSTCKLGNLMNRGFEIIHNKIGTVPDKMNGKQKTSGEVNNEHFIKCNLKVNTIDGFKNEEETQVNQKINFKGFQMASGKNVFISKEAMDKCAQLLQDFEDDEELYKTCSDFGKEKLVTNTKMTKNMSKITANKNSVVEINNDKSSLNKDNIILDKYNLSNQVFKGFQTASKKNIKISDEALAKSKEIFKDLEFNKNDYYPNKVQEEYPDLSIDVKCKYANDSTKLNMNEFKKQGDDHDFNVNQPSSDDQNFKIDRPMQFKGFQTASNKVIKISEKALANSKKIFHDLDPIHVEPYQKNFKRLSGEQVKITQAIDSKIKLEQNFVSDSSNYELNYDTNHSKINEPQLVNNENIEIEVTKEKCKVLDNRNLRNNRMLFGDGFIGFQTGSNKRVKISDDALAASKKIFQDLNLNDDHKQSSNNINKLKQKISVPGNISKSKHILKTKRNSNADDLRFEIEYNNIEGSVHSNQNDDLPVDKLVEKYENKFNLENIIDTQVLNNFEQTLCTEDFCNEITPSKSKRSGSPILCPRVKKRKEFKVPYRSDKKQKSEPKSIDSEKIIPITFAFDDNYKKNKKMSLVDLKNMEKHVDGVFEVDSYILSFTYDNLLDFKFYDNRNELSENTWSTKDLKNHFLTLVKRNIIPDGWLDNHLKLIISKLIYYEIEYRNVMCGVCSVRNVLEQLKYRYDKELYNVERPAFRKILEKDDVSTKTMVLRVVAIYVEGVPVSSVTDTDDVELLLTDGWYCIKACLDPMLRKLVSSRKIKVGTKLATHGAELLNCEQGVAPWEDTSSVRLKLFGNSTRRARWNARLGYHNAAAILSPLSCVDLDGGKVPKMRVFVTRVYPALYVEKFDDGSTVTRSERLEHLHQMKHESEIQALLEKLHEEVEREFIDKESQNSESDNDVRRSLESGSQINRLMKQSKYPEEFIENLTNTQCVMLQDYTSRRREKLLQLMQAQLLEKLKAKGLHNGRNVVPVLKIRIADVSGDGEVAKAMMSIWRPNEIVLDVIKEGTWIEVFNTAPTAVRYSEIQFSASRRTIFKRSNYKQNEKVNCITSKLGRTCYSMKDLVQNLSKHAQYNEIDTVGLVFLIDPSNDRFESIKGQLFQNVYLTDAEKNMVCVNFWGGLRKFGYENILDTGQVIAAINLQNRVGNSRNSILQFRATEFSYFTKTSKFASLRKLTDDLNKALTRIDIKKLCEECKAMKNDSLLKNNVENVSPYRIDYSAYNISKHRAFVDSPLTRKPNQVDNIVNRSGFNFEPNFEKVDIQNMSMSMLLKKKIVNEKIEKLKMYGEPPPLNCIHMINKSKNASSAFKSPFSINNDISNNVNKHLKEIPNEVDNVSCPVITNANNIEKRKSGNPVKLNFNKAPSKDSDINVADPFAEEFDASLPLSLD